jgi:ribosomal-protein-serine acetyltransferase
MDKSVSKPIGMLFIKSLDWRIPKAELAYYIDKEYEGKGIISKALNNVIEFAFSVLKLNKLYLRVAPDNKGSRKVAEKNSFKIEGTLRNDFKTYEGALIDLLYYGLINNKNSTL